MSESPDSAVMVPAIEVSQTAEKPREHIHNLFWKKLSRKEAFELLVISLVTGSMFLGFFLFFHLTSNNLATDHASSIALRLIADQLKLIADILLTDFIRILLRGTAAGLPWYIGIRLLVRLFKKQIICDPKASEFVKDIVRIARSGQ